MSGPSCRAALERLEQAKCCLTLIVDHVALLLLKADHAIEAEALRGAERALSQEAHDFAEEWFAAQRRQA